MAVDLLNRQMTFIATFFAMVGVVLGVVALATNYWTLENISTPNQALPILNGTVVTPGIEDWMWNGLFYTCSMRVQCFTRFWTTPFVLCLLGIIFLLVGGIFLCWDMFKISDRRFVIPMLMFVACVLMTAGLCDYGSMARLNSHSSRTMIAAVVFAYIALPISAFIAGRYSAFDRFVTTTHVTNGQKYVSTSTNGN